MPRCRPDNFIDFMVEVLSSIELHLAAADGYVKTGFLASLDDSSGDNFIVREAGVFWKELHMRAKINSAVADVRREVLAGRLRWSNADVNRLIKPYPKRRKVDEVLAAIGDDTWIPDDERPYAPDDDEPIDQGTGGEESSHDDDDGDAIFPAVAEDFEPNAEGGESLVVAPPLEAAVDVICSGDVAESVLNSQRTIATFESAIAALLSTWRTKPGRRSGGCAAVAGKTLMCCAR